MKQSKAIKYNVVQTIIQVAKKLERSKLNKGVIEDIKEPLDLLSDYLGINIEETQLFAVTFALQARTNFIDLRDIISFLDISYIDSLSLKSGIDSLLEKNLIEQEEENGRKCRKTKYGKSSFSIPDDISDQIYANTPLKVKENKSIDIYEFTKTISDLVQKRKYENISTMDLFFMVDALEEKNIHLAPISKIKSKLNVEDRAILYEMLNDRIAYGAPTSALELTINDIYENARERRLKIRQLVENAIRPLAIGRKNYLFCGNSDAAIRAAMVYSLLGSCKAAGVNPAEWLEDVLSKIYSYTKENRNLEELLPHLWKK